MKNVLDKIFLFIVINLLAYSYSQGNDTLFTSGEFMALQVRSGIGYNMYKSMIVRLPGSEDCGLFEKGGGIGFSIGFTPEKKINNWLALGIGLFYIDRSGTLSNESTLPFRDTKTNKLINLNTENRLKANISFFEIMPELRFMLFDDLINGPFKIFCGLRFGLPIRNSFSQSEYIVSPDDQVFLNNKREREIAKGDISNISSFHYGISMGMENLLKVGKTDYFTQQLSFDYNLNHVVDDLEWKIFSVRLELGYRYSFAKEETIIIEDTVVPADTVFVKPKPEVKVPFFSVKFSEETEKLQLAEGKELLATLPLVNAIFFERNSAEIPEEYITMNKDLPSAYFGDAVEYSKYLLPRISEIIKKNPNAKIKVIGYTSGLENEAGGLDLAAKRAESCKRAMKNLGIADSVIVTDYRLEPLAASNKNYDEGIKENQRADIIIENAPLQEYVGVEKYLELSGSTDLIIDFKDVPEMEELFLEVNFYDTVIVCRKPGIYRIPVKMRILENKDSLELRAKLLLGNLVKECSRKIELKGHARVINELAVENFRAILRFDYNSSELSYNNKELLKQMSEIVPDNAKIIINGSADALGTEQQNLELARNRALSTKEYLKNAVGINNEIIIKNEFEKFTENKAIGRFLNRSISIEIEY
jgi:outer membrane protein OmpA-like peptidoglycan-associated protein